MIALNYIENLVLYVLTADHEVNFIEEYTDFVILIFYNQFP